MPAFVSNGPDIPEHLIQLHEEGNVVFFCGAGISYRAGLPGFEGLVNKIYKELGTKRTSIESKSYEAEQYDAVLHQLERRFPGQRVAVRKVLEKVLKPKWKKPGATDTHQALLQLATDRSGVVRIVTTNFDRIFDRAAKKIKVKPSNYSAPLLPVPKQSRWDGVVYLHGLMPASYEESALNRLILTSGDFGLAYLTERWAARFVSHLFQDYTVCFVGYSINDPVLRYMMDALAADELLGEVRREAYAFGSYTKGSEDEVYKEWEAKGVTPLLYEVPPGTGNHSALYDTLKEWGDAYRDGVRGREMVIAQHASTPPLTSSRSDFAVGRVLWALSDGLAAKHFSELEPLPPLKWLEPFSESQFTHKDLLRFGVTPNHPPDEKLLYSIVSRPAPYTKSPRMTIFDAGSNSGHWDDVMHYLGNWLLRHLGDHNLILWIAQRGGLLDEKFKTLVRQRIENLARLEAQEETAELDRIVAGSPLAIPNLMVMTLWQIILSDRVKNHARQFNLYSFVRRLERYGATSSLRYEFRNLLAPCVVLRKPFRLDEVDEISEIKRIKDIVGWELSIKCDHVYSLLIKRIYSEEWQTILPHLLDDVVSLLKDAMDLSRELGGANNKSDHSYIYQPSISSHEQNKGYKDWTALVVLIREAWLRMALVDHLKAKRVAEMWWHYPYPVFKRLAMFAAAQDEVISQDIVVGWIVEDDGWWLWSAETRREMCRLLVSLSPRLSVENRLELENAILAGPPREIYMDLLEDEDFIRRTDGSIWRLLMKLQSAGGSLGNEAAIRLNNLLQKYPDLRQDEDEQDEFPYWTDRVATGEPETTSEFELAPASRPELVLWLRSNPSSDKLHYHDGWPEICRDNFEVAAGALSDLAENEVWLSDRWSELLQVGTEDMFIQPSWDSVYNIILTSTDEFIQSISHTLSSWVKAISKTFDGHDKEFFELCRRLLAVKYDGVMHTDEIVSRAINHPVGHVTEALLQWWYRENLKDDQGLDEEIKLIFTEICNTQIEIFRHGRVLLSAHAIALFRVDKDWATEYLLPLFHWGRSHIESCSAWEGFLWSPRIYQPFLSAIKEQILDTSAHYNDLGEHREQYADFLTFVALDPGDSFSLEELTTAIGRLPAPGLRESAEALSRALSGAEDQRSTYWKNRVKPFIHHIWPKTRDLSTPEISESIAKVCVSARESFPEAIDEFQYWLQVVEDPDYLIYLLHNAGLCDLFPNDALAYLDALVGNELQWIPTELQPCLNTISQSKPDSINDPRYIRLRELIRRYA